MEKIKTTILASLIIAASFHGFAQPKEAIATPARPAVVKDPAFEKVTDDPRLPRVLLIGDSISIGYTVPVRNLLKGRANVHRIPENGGPTTNGLAKMKSWLGDTKWDVIHFNFGLHDLKLVAAGQRRLTVEEYEKNLRELVRQLNGTKAKLIWANTTPVPGPAAKLGRITEDVPIYNAAAAKVMEENKITTDDLYAFALPQLSKIQRTENVHYTDEGYAILAGKVAASIETLLPKKQ
ncbi:MAG: SGNH/GDSL hydrolase family protein [Verrucomicrobiota bacterium]